MSPRWRSHWRACSLARISVLRRRRAARASCLHTSTSGQPLFAGDSGLFLIVFTHGSGFPLAHTAPHEPRAVGFANIFAFDEDVEHSHVSAVVVQVKFTARSRESSPGHTYQRP